MNVEEKKGRMDREPYDWHDCPRCGDDCSCERADLHCAHTCRYEGRVEEGGDRPAQTSTDAYGPLEIGRPVAGAASTAPPAVEDSHAKLAADMRASAAHWGGALPRADAFGVEWAARVEALGRAEEKKAAKANDPRAAFDAAFTLGVAFGCGLNGQSEAEAAIRLERVPTAAVCDEFWAKWQANVAEESASKKEDA